jgi:predicted glycosyl hydrolase (DUF1957 family)
MSIDNLKTKAVTGATKIAMSPPVMKMLSNPNVQKAFLTMMNANADFREWLDNQIKGVARGMNLVTSEELGALRRQLRECGSDLATALDRVDALEQEVSGLNAAAKKKSPAKKTAKKTTKKTTKKTK